MRFPVFTYLLLAGLIIHGLTTDSQAGNKWMMEKNANELVMLNSMLLSRIGTIQKDGKIILSGEVIHEDGKTIIKLYQLQQIPASNEGQLFAPETFDKNLPYQIFLREEALTEIPFPEDGQKE